MDKAPIRVLLIEDNPVDIIFLREALDGDALNSFDITAVERLQSAVETLQKQPFDIILLDLGLPDSQGLETFTRINQAVPEMPKVILSGLTDETFALQAVQAGAQDYIVKGTAGFSFAARAICYAIERQKAQTALRASEERFRAMIENGLDDISLLDANGTLLWESPSVIRNLGYPVDTFVGQNIFGIVHPDDRGWTSDLYTKVLQTPGSREAGVFRLQHANGSWRWIEAIVTNMVNNPSMKAVVVNYRDITERKHAEEALRVSETRYRGIFDGVQDAIFVENLNGEILDVNRRACEIYGYTHAEFITKKLIDIVPSEEHIIRLWDEDNASLERPYETINVRANGERFPVEIRGGFYEFDGRKLFLVVLRDITERKKSEIMIEQQNNDLKLINAINEAVVQGVNLNKIMDLLAKEMKRVFSIEGTSIYMLDPDGQSLAMQQFFLSPELTRSIEKVIGSTVPLIHIPIKEGSYFQKFIRAGHGTIMSNPEDIQKWMAEFVETSFLPPAARSAARKLIPQIYKLIHIKSTIIVPLISNGKTIGLLNVSSPNLFINEDLLRIENICGQLTTAIQRQQANEKIQKSEEFLNSVQNALSANLAILDEKGNIVRVNAAWRKFGELNGLMSPNSCVGLNYLDVCDSARGPYAEEARTTADAIRAVIAGQIREASIEYPCHSLEEKRWFLLRITKFDDGDHIWVVLAHENITKRKQAEDAVRETSEQFQVLFEASPEAIMLIDPHADWSILDCNTIACAMNGYTRDELIGQSVNIFNLTTGDPQERSTYLENVRRAGVLHVETSHRRKDGTVFPIDVSTSLITLAGREVILGIDRDITERKQAENSLRESEQRYRALFEDMPIAIWEEDFSEAKQQLDALKAAGVTDFHAYFAAHPEAATELSNQFKIIDVNNTALQMFQAANKQELIESTYREPSLGEQEHRLEDLIAIAEGKPGNQWEGRDTTLTGKILDISLSWSVVPGYEKDYSRVIVSTVDITERKRTEIELTSSHSLLTATFESTADGILVVGKNGEITSFNNRFLKLWHIPHELAEQGADRLLLEFVFSQLKDPAAFIAKVDELYHAPEETSVDELEFLDGRIYERYSQPQRLGTTVIGRVWSFREITERKRADEQVRESEARFASIFRTNPARVSITSFEDSRFLDVNDAFLASTGYPREEVIGYTSAELNDWVNPQDRLRLRTLLEAQGRVKNFETQLRQKSGNILEVLISAELIELFGQRCILSASLDITERKQNEQKLLEANERFTQLADNIQEVFWITDAVSGQEIYISPAGEKIWGHSIEDLMHIPDIFINTILPEDRPMVLSTIEKQRTGQNTEMEYRIVHPDGSVRWVWDRAFPIFDEAGKLMRLAGIAADITERKQVDNALRSRDDLLREAQRIARLGHYQLDIPTGSWESSDVLNDVFGIDTDYIKDLNGWAGLIHPIQRDEMLAYFKTDVVEAHKPFDREYQIIRNDNRQTRWVHGLGQLEFDSMGNPVRMIGTIQDITERRQAEAETRRHLAELQALYENGLAVGRLLEPREIGERIIETFARHLSWHHVAIRLRRPESEVLELVAFNQPDLSNEERSKIEHHFNSMISNVGLGLSGWVVSTGEPIRAGDVRAHAQYVDTHPGIQSGLYMPLKIGERVIGVISVESKEPDAFTAQDERLLATLANQAAVAFENARLYQASQQELLERKRIEMELRASETHYRELSDSITDVFFELDHDLHYSHWNNASEILTGVLQENAIGRSMREIFGDSEEQTRIERIYKDILAKHVPRMFETFFVVNDQTRSFEANAYPSSNGVAVVAKDITDRKRSDTIMQKRFELMEYAARHSLDELMQKTIDEVSDLTGSTIGFFHIPAADQTSPGMQIWSTKTPSRFNVPVSEDEYRAVEQAEAWAEAVRQRRAILHNEYESLPNKKTLPTGHAPVIREMVIPILRNERILAVIGIANKPVDYTQQDLEITERFVDYAWDITERKQMGMALAEERNQLALRVEERTADFSRANANLARALRVKDEFLANMSHELRTPLNAILGLSESLAEQTAGPLNEKQQRYITTVTESGHHLLSLINDILDLAKIEAGQITLDVHEVDLHSVCEASLRMIKQLALKKNQVISLEIDQGVGLMWADERRLKQMLVNLLSNAVKFTPENGKLGLEVRGDQDANKVAFTIWDTGIGIKEDDLSRLFQPFVQLDTGLARESSGTGLGLALVAQMARLHGGSVSVISQPGKGSHFTIMLPWEPALAVDTVERLKSTGKFRPIKFGTDHKPTILLIEDTEEVIMMISDYLELNGFKVVSARDGIEGVTQAQLTHPDLILMDIQMPRMDGFEAAKKLRSEPDFKRTPIIALTALAMPNDRERCLAAGMDEYITKPVHLRALVKIIENFLAGDMEVKPQ